MRMEDIEVSKDKKLLEHILSTHIENGNLVMDSSSAAIWSAIAATSAAISSFLIWRAQKKNIAQNVLPQIVLSDWKRIDDENHTYIEIGEITNVGKGEALHVYIHGIVETDISILAMGEFRHPILAPNGTLDFNKKAKIRWADIPVSNTGNKESAVNINISCQDTIGTEHNTTYFLRVVEKPDQQHIGNNQIAEGVSLVLRRLKTTTLSERHLKNLLREFKRDKVGFFKSKIYRLRNMFF